MRDPIKDIIPVTAKIEPRIPNWSGVYSLDNIGDAIIPISCARLLPPTRTVKFFARLDLNISRKLIVSYLGRTLLIYPSTAFSFGIIFPGFPITIELSGTSKFT